MKTLLITCSIIFTSLSLHAEESIEDNLLAPADSDVYIDEIRSACQSEAAGLPDAEEYIRDCIEAMKQSFNN